MFPRFCLSVLSAELALLAMAAAPARAQRGSVTGHVSDRANGAAVPAASVVIVGTTRGTTTGADGHYRIINLPRGAAQIRVLRLGFEPQTSNVQIPDTGTVTVDFTLVPSAVKLDQVVVSAAGEQQRQRETGNAVSSISPDSIAQPAVASFSDLLNSRATGVSVVQQSGTTGGASKIRIRGANSVSLSNDPLLVIDGNRVDNNSNSASSNLFTGGQTPSRFDDLNPDEIEDVQILKGPAASALYGTAGANGVILVTTKHGVPGRTKWSAHAEYGSVRDYTDYPPNFTINGLALDGNGQPIAGDTVVGCLVATKGQPDGCNPIASSLLAFNPMSAISPFVAGYRESYGITASGGTENLTYFLSAEDYNEQGVYINNRSRRTNLRANFGAQLSSVLNAHVNVGYLQSRLDLPQNDNSLFGVIGLSLTGTAINDPVCHGFFACITPDQAALLLTEQDIDRFTTSADLNYHPTSWFSGVATGGLDLGDRFDNAFTPPNVLPGSQGAGLGAAAPAPYTLWTYTANLSGTFKFDINPSIRSTTTIGTQFVDQTSRGIVSSGAGIVPGLGNLAGATSQFTTTQPDSTIVTFGGLGSQQFSWRDKVFLTAAVRADESSAFGTQNDLVWYPNFSASWVLGEEPFFPKSAIVSSLRVRGAYGESGQRPAFRQAETFFQAIGSTREGVDVGGLTLGGIGTPTLKPEVSREIEGGLDVGFWRDRINVEFTVYNKTTSDALIQLTYPPSACGLNLGSNATNLSTCVAFHNLGEVNNNGFELGINGTVVDTRRFRFDMTINGAENNNKLITLGLPAPIVFNTAAVNPTQEFIAGKPLGVYTAIPYTFKDLNHDGIIEPNEVTLGKNPVFLGGPNPKGEWTLVPEFTFFGLVKVSSTFDRRYGSRTLNFSEEFRCIDAVNCQGMFDPHAPLARQAAFVGAEFLGTDYGYIENNAFWKWRELAVTLIAPRAWTRKLHVSDLSLQLAERNVATWTHYTGYDPEINFISTGSNFTTADFLTQPPVRYYTMRINLGL